MTVKYKKKKQVFELEANIHKFSLAGWIEKGSKELDEVREYLKTKNQTLFKSLADRGVILDYECDHNLVVTTGLNVLARLLAGDSTYSGEVNYGAVGIGATPVPALGDTTLISEQFRSLQQSQSASAGVAYIDFFYSAGDFDTDSIGAITEFGNFIDGTSSVDTGQMFSFIATGGWTKNATTSLFVSCEYTLANA